MAERWLSLPHCIFSLPYRYHSLFSPRSTCSSSNFLCFLALEKNGDLPIHLAALNGSLEVVELLVECDYSTVSVKNEVSGVVLHSFSFVVSSVD